MTAGRFTRASYRFDKTVRTIRVGNGCGFWGDSLDAPVRLVEHGQLDYLTLEYLAELTLSIMAHQRGRDPTAGYAADFIDVLGSLTHHLRRQPQLRVITNAGGMNPASCAAAARNVLNEARLENARIATVSGDDLVGRLHSLIQAGHHFAHLDTGQPLESVLDRVVSANAYLGAGPIVEALARGARVVITGRVADASLTVAPAIHEFGWPPHDWTRIAGAAVAGHLIECGAQSTGGLYCDWFDVPDYPNIGYPIAVIAEDGSFEITKPHGTGGLVNRETVTEQLLYEIGDPTDYVTPDVCVDFTSLKLDAGREGPVRVTGACGRAPPDSYKVSIAYRDGYMASGMLVVAGRDAREKAEACGRIILDRMASAGARPGRSNIEVIGSNTGPDRSVVLRVTVHDVTRSLVDRFCRELAPLVTSGPPGITGYTGGRPKPREVLAYWPALVSRDVVKPVVCVEGDS
jgi:hypothetical protein